MVLLVPGGTVPMIRLRRRSLDMTVAGTLASKLARNINAGGRSRARQIWRRPHRQRCGLLYELRPGERRWPSGVPKSEWPACGRRTFDARTLSAIKMPNRSIFVGDPRPEVKKPGMHDRLLRK